MGTCSRVVSLGVWRVRRRRGPADHAGACLLRRPGEPPPPLGGVVRGQGRLPLRAGVPAVVPSRGCASRIARPGRDVSARRHHSSAPVQVSAAAAIRAATARHAARSTSRPSSPLIAVATWSERGADARREQPVRGREHFHDRLLTSRAGADPSSTCSSWPVSSSPSSLRFFSCQAPKL